MFAPRLYAAILLFLCPAVASAQFVDRKNFDANRLRPAMGQEGVLTLETGEIPHHLAWDAALWLNYVNDALVLNEARGDGTVRVASLLKDRVDAHFIGAIALIDWLQIGLDIPIALYQRRGPKAVNTLGFGSLKAAGVGDLAVTPKLRILNAEDHIVDLAILARVTIPSATRNAYLGEKTATVTPELALSYRWGELTYAANVAFVFRKNLPARNIGLNIDHEMILRLGAKYDFEKLTDVPMYASAALEGFTQTRRPFANGNASGAEWLVDVGYRVHPMVSVFGGGGTSLLSAYSIPDYRVFAGVRGSWRETDRDGDGVLDGDDACPDEKEDVDTFEDANGCPDPDNDGDGVLDADDGAPLEAEDVDGFEDDDGVPDPDNDKDGVADVDDGAPLDPEDIDGFEDEDGVPDPDNDGDGILDVDDGAPNEPEDVDGFEDEDGVPDPDNDGDGVLDVEDKCPKNKGDAAHQGCPATDRDKDGIEDKADKCPDQAEDADGFEDTDGCPDLDNDGDGLEDTVDRCVNEPGPVENAGCPDTDRDGDTVVDRLDNCPDEAGDVENQGCKVRQLVVIRGCKIDITEKVYFDPGRDTIQERSFPVLDNIADVLKKQIQIKKLRVEGHTDSDGSASGNKRLSELRASAVNVYLGQKGIAAERLEAVGFGEEKPIQSNRTSRGKAANRRVEFFIADCKASSGKVK